MEEPRDKSDPKKPMTNHEPQHAGPDSALLVMPQHPFVPSLNSALRGSGQVLEMQL